MARIIIIAFPGAQTLDVTGPAEVFAGASRQLGVSSYDVVLASTRGKTVQMTSNSVVETTALTELRPRASDTVLVAGGEDQAVRAAISDARLRLWLIHAAMVVRRIGSVCSGAFVLAAAGLLDHKRAATHWSACAELALFRPAVKVDRDAIYVTDGKTWTSAGVTTGIDMALAMVEEDLGRSVADKVAARLVLYARRPGFQSQFTDALVAQRDSSDPLGVIIGRARAHLRSLDVPRLAKLVGLSVRTLHRRCVEALGLTPAKLVLRLRVEHARTLLSSTSRSQKVVAHAAGFSSVEHMNRAFDHELGVRPRDVRMMFGARKNKPIT